jgi:hypothetical protein
MKNTVFRSAEFWKSAIMTLPDHSFFELLRSVFGKIKTPYNKQMLLDDLEAFLSRKDIQKNIACYIDQDEARIISAAAILNEPAPGDLESFFSGELSYAAIQDKLINLEERFILYRFREKGPSRLALNPVLEPVLAPFIADTALLFPSLPAPEGVVDQAGAVPPLDDRILAALLSFVSEGEAFFKNEGGIRKRVIDAGGRVFPGLDLESLIGGLRVLGLFRAEEDRLVPDYHRFSEFGALTPRERMEYCASGICCFLDAESPADISPYLFRVRVRRLAGLMRQLLSSLEADRIYPVSTLKRFADLLLRGGGETAPFAENEKKCRPASFIDSLVRTGLLFPQRTEYLRPGIAGEAGRKDDGAAVIAMDTVFSCLVYPEISYADAISLAAMLNVREAGVSIRFELTRDSAVRAFDRGISAGVMIELLKRLSAHRIDENLVWTLNEWEKRYGEVVLRRGLVLSLSPERRYLAETQALARLIRETLAPGIYLLAETAETEAAGILRKAGVDIIASRGGEAALPASTSPQFPPPADPPGPAAARKRGLSALKGTRAATPDDAAAATLIAAFHSILEPMRLSKAERDELAARIDRRLVLCESQLRDASIRYEKLEARGLDYVGKAAIAKQAIASGSPLELVLPGKKGERIFGIPRAVEKKGGEESVLVIDPHGDSGGESLRVPLGKISLLRRIKKSLFENNA